MNNPIDCLVAALELAESLPRDENGFLTKQSQKAVTAAYGAVDDRSSDNVKPSPLGKSFVPTCPVCNSPAKSSGSSVFCSAPPCEWSESVSVFVKQLIGYQTKALHKFSSTQINLRDVGRGVSFVPKLTELAASIPDEDLASDGREEDFHITIKYGLHTNKAEDVRKVVEGFGLIEYRLGKVSLFQSEEHDVVKIDVVSDDLHRLNKLISSSLECTDTHPTYKPHVTIAYVKPGLGEKYAGMFDFAGSQNGCQHMEFSDLDRKITVIDLMREPLSMQIKSAGTCKPGERADLTGCTPASGNVSNPSHTEHQPEAQQQPSDQPGSEPEEGEEKARSILSAIAGLPGRLVPASVKSAAKKVKDKVIGVMVNRYGERTTGIILKVAALSAPVPVPGSQPIAIATSLVIAEAVLAYKKLRGSKAMERELTEEEIQQAAAELLKLIEQELKQELSQSVKPSPFADRKTLSAYNASAGGVLVPESALAKRKKSPFAGRKSIKSEGRWITLDPSGTHVHLDSGGGIDKGPDKMEGKKPSELKEGQTVKPSPFKRSEEQEDKPDTSNEEENKKHRATAENPKPSPPQTHHVFRGSGRTEMQGSANDSGVAGKGEYWSGDRDVAAAYAGRNGSIKEGDIHLKTPLVMDYPELNKLQEKLYGRRLTGFEADLSEKFDNWLRENGFDGVVLYDTEISNTIPQEVVKLGTRNATVKSSPFKGGRKSIRTFDYSVKDQGQPCKQGEAASRTGCIPASGEAGQQSSPDKTARTFQEKVKVSNPARIVVEQLANGNSLVIQQGSIVKDGVKMPVYRWAETQGGKTAVNAGAWTNQLMYARRGAEQHSKDSKKTAAQSQQSSELKKKLAAAPVANASNLQATYNTVLLVEFEDGSEAIFKPGSGELGDEDNRPLRSAVPTGKMYLREIAASSVADVLGLSDLVPATVLREEQGEAGSAQEYVTEALPAVKVRADNKEIYDGPDLIRAAVFDYLMCNQDRHMGNWMVKNDGGIRLIDNGLSLPTAYDGDDFLSGNLRFFNEADRQNLTLPDLSAWDGKWPEVEKSLADIEPEAVQLCKERFDSLVKASKEKAKFMDLPGLMDGKQTLRDWWWVFGRK